MNRALEQIKKVGNCPEGYNWKRKSGGYQCERGGHGVTDALLAEGKAGVVAFKKGSSMNWEDKNDWDGVYYKTGNIREGKPCYSKVDIDAVVE